MRTPKDYTLYYEDRLVRRFRAEVGYDHPKPTINHGKRVGKDCPLTHEEVRAYVKCCAIDTVKLLRKRGMALREAMDTLNQARGERKWHR